MPPDGHCSPHACQKSYDLYLTEARSLLNSMLNCYTLDIFLFSLSCNSEVSFFHSSETFIIFCKYYASPRTSEQPMNPVNNEQWTVNNNQWTMTPAENMYISMKCSVCTISYTVINIDKKNEVTFKVVASADGRFHECQCLYNYLNSEHEFFLNQTLFCRNVANRFSKCQNKYGLAVSNLEPW